MDRNKVNAAYKSIRTIPMSTEANDALRIGKLEIEEYDETDLPFRIKNQVKETLRHYATCNFISRQLDEGKSEEDIADMSVDKLAVNDTLEATHMMIFSGMFNFPREK